jgi:hypothetical protein
LLNAKSGLGYKIKRNILSLGAGVSFKVTENPSGISERERERGMKRSEYIS